MKKIILRAMDDQGFTYEFHIELQGKLPKMDDVKGFMAVNQRNQQIDKDMHELHRCRERLLVDSDDADALMAKGNHAANNAIYCLSYIFSFNGDGFMIDNFSKQRNALLLKHGEKGRVMNPRTWIAYLPMLRKALCKYIEK